MTYVYTGAPCPSGHVLRYRGGSCVACVRSHNDARRSANPAAHKEYRRKWAANNRAQLRDIRGQWAKRNPELAKADNAHNRNMQRAKTYAARCECCSGALFRFVYFCAQSAGREVDHRRPLAVGGRHCVQNLQALSKAQHAEKTRRDISVMSKARTDWTYIADSPDWQIPADLGPEIDLAGIALEVLRANPGLIHHFE